MFFLNSLIIAAKIASLAGAHSKLIFFKFFYPFFLLSVLLLFQPAAHVFAMQNTSPRIYGSGSALSTYEDLRFEHFTSQEKLYSNLVPNFLRDTTTNPPWWESNWFLGGLILIIIGGLIWIITSLPLRRRSREQELEALVAGGTQELAFAQAQINILFEDSPIAIGTASMEGVILTANDAMADIFGYPKEELLGTEIMAFFPDHELRRALIERLKVEKTIRALNLQLRRKDGSLFYANLTESILTREGKDVILGVVDDITTQVLAEQALKEKDEAAVIAAERERLARELHDSVTQSIFTSSMIAEALPDVWKTHPQEAMDSLKDLRQLNEGALAEMRSLLLELRPDEIADQPLDDLLYQLREAMSARSQLLITISISGEFRLEKPVQIAFYRIAQEALNNISKHSRAEQAWISLRCNPNGSSLHIRDNGVGFNPNSVHSTHLGLKIMRDRAESVGAQLSIASHPDQGTEVTVEWSVPRMEHDHG